jgi:tight adherence protein B
VTRRALQLSVLVAALVAVGAATADPSDVKLTPLKSTFPERSYVLSLPSGVQASDVTVTENGHPVADVALGPTSSVRGRTFGTVLVIDASNSMSGKPLADAYAAARVFVARRNANQRIGVVTFDGGVATRLVPTTNVSRIDAALASPPATGEGTRIYDGVARALGVLRRARIASGSIVLLSDGADTGSTVNEQKTLARARAQHVRIFSVGLESPQYNAATLDSISAATIGSYSQATNSKDLAAVYDALGSRLANEYLLQYKSYATPSEHVDVAVDVAGTRGTATASYTSPGLNLNATPPPIHRSTVDRALQSTGTMLVIIALVAVLLGVGAIALLRTRTNQFRRRLGAFVSVLQPEEAEQHAAATADDGSTRRTWWEKFELDVALAELEISPANLAIAVLLVTVLAIWICSLFSLILAVFAFFLPLMARMFVRSLADRKKRLFGEQLPDNLQVLSSALRAGHSLVGALSVVVADAPDPSGREFRQVLADEQVGMPLDDALRRVAVRMDNRDLEQVALVAALQRETGAGAAEVLDRVAETVRERAALRRLIRVLTAQGRMARWIVSALPIFLLLVISVLNPDYMKPLFTKPVGQVLVVFAGVMVIAGSLVIKKIMNIKV